MGGWSPAGNRVVYSSRRQKNGRCGIFSKVASGAEPERTHLLTSDAGHVADDWSRDGRVASLDTEQAPSITLVVNFREALGK